MRHIGDPAGHSDVLQRHVGEEPSEALVGIAGDEDLLDPLGRDGIAGPQTMSKSAPQRHHLLSVATENEESIVADYALDAHPDNLLSD